MGRIKDAIQDWLEDYGYSQGFDMTNYPAIEDWDSIKLNKLDAKEYYDGKQAQKSNKTR